MRRLFCVKYKTDSLTFSSFAVMFLLQKCQVSEQKFKCGMMNRRYRHFLDSNGRIFFIRSSTAICSETFLHKLPMCLSNFILSYFHSKIAVLPVTLPLHYNAWYLEASLFIPFCSYHLSTFARSAFIISHHFLRCAVTEKSLCIVSIRG